MSISTLSQSAAQEIANAVDLNETQIREIIETSMIKLLTEFNTECKSAINLCCSADQDTAHKLEEEIQKRRQNLIANLSSLR
ncbi:hypothetical protein [Curvivirga sp.]|uniref:hypothetical protein n=1 Tax=Curvivirga sp. TaxID=2856848 RepID=UPI003B5C84E2